MPLLSNKSSEKLSGCHKDLQLICYEVIKVYDFTVACGQRGEQDQNQAFAEKKSKLKFPDSLHNKFPSMAIDVYPVINKKIEMNDLKTFAFQAGVFYTVAKRLLAEGKISHKIRFGCDWDSDFEFNDESFLDFPHIELIGA